MQKFKFEPSEHTQNLINIFENLYKLDKKETLTESSLRKTLNLYPKASGLLFSKDELLAGYKYLKRLNLLKKGSYQPSILRMKPVRTSSGVAPITVLTEPYPCPGKCIFCPSQKNMPQSYLADEPGAQRAALLNFDPYDQVAKRIQAFEAIGHIPEKIELIILGGSWSVYPNQYKNWFIQNCINAMNQTAKLQQQENSTIEDILEAQQLNRKAKYRCVGISVETRPDLITEDELINLRTLGVTKIQLGIQTLDNELLEKNHRGHTAEDSANAFRLLRIFGFKIQIHWMPNLFGSTPSHDIDDYKKLWSKDFRPDEVKIYPTSILPGTQLETLYKNGAYSPYNKNELLNIITSLKKQTPEYCRITRIIRDIPAQNIIAGNKQSNFREIAQKELEKQGVKCQCIRCREIRDDKYRDLKLKINKYSTSIGTEYFLSYCSDKDNRLAGFLRLAIPDHNNSENHILPELRDKAIIREIHVYGNLAAVGEDNDKKTQHKGLGTNLIKKAKEIARENEYKKIAVIAAIGTQDYYKKKGFLNSGIYMTSNTDNLN